MQITSVSVHKIEKENSRMKGIASVIIDDAFKIRDIRIIQGEEKLFIAMPSRKATTGEYIDIAHPLNQDVRTMFEKAIFDEYKKVENEEN